VFLIIVVALLYGTARVAGAFRLAPLWRQSSARMVDAIRGEDRRAAAAAGGAAAAATATEGRTRAATVVDAVAATQRREAGQAGAAAVRIAGGGGEGAGGRRTAPMPSGRTTIEPLGPTPLGQSFPRRTRGRVSASAGRRDRRI
jgi:type IV secretion system protein VirB6